MSTNFLRRFMENQAAGGVFLMLATAFALFFANTPLRGFYDHFLHAALSFDMGGEEASISVLHFINDVLMSFFFLVVGCELKRERIEGELSCSDQARLPVIAALSGMVVPALIFSAVAFSFGGTMQGWAIPTATDIAFAIGIFMLLGPKVPLCLKILLLAIAIIDDLGAIVIIGLFFSHDVNLLALGVAALASGVLWLLNKRNVEALAAYFLTGIALWLALHEAGVHATLSGVIVGFFLPLRVDGEEGEGMVSARVSPLKKVEKALQPWVVFGILPVFAFANAGVALEGIGMKDFLDPLPLGILCGLIFGKQAGIFLAIWLAVKAGVASLPRGARWRHVYGLSLLCGIGFTMSLFIGTLAYSEPEAQNLIRLGVLTGSSLSALAGYAVLAWGASSQSAD